MSLNVGVAWFAEEQWPRYRQLMTDDTDELYADWRKKAQETFDRLKKEGVRVRKVPIDLTEFELWCRASQKPFTGASRAAYAQHLLTTKQA
jgi:hypothetical protein